MKKYLAEGFGTFILVFCGTCTIVLNKESEGMVTKMDIALAFGLSVMAMVFFFRRISGAYINPALTLAAAYDKRLSKKYIFPYVIAQITGAILASLLLRCIFPVSSSLAVTLPAGGVMMSLIIEFVFSLALMYTVLNSGGRLTGIVVGVVVAVEAFLGGKISGASMNPARSIGPALVSLNFEYLWIYIAAPIAGAFAAVLLNRMYSLKNDK